MLCRAHVGARWAAPGRSLPTAGPHAHAAVRRHCSSGPLRSPHKATATASNAVTAAVQVRQASEQLAGALEAAAATGLSQEAVAELKHIHSLADQVNTTLKKEARLQALRWALANVKQMYQSSSGLLEDFTYTYDWSNKSTTTASDAVICTLLSAMMDNGCFVQLSQPQDKKARGNADWH
jgi:hypothetical protein